MRSRLFFLLLFIVSEIYAQDEIPLGEWRTHLTYSNVSDIQFANDKLYALAGNTIFSYDPIEHSVEQAGRVKAFDAQIITAIGSASAGLLVGFESGLFAVMTSTEVIIIDDIARSNVQGGQKIINHFYSSQNLVYISTGFGLVVYNLRDKKVINTYWQLGANGEVIASIGAVVSNNRLYVATQESVLEGLLDPTVNLQDFASWSRTGISLNNKISKIALLGEVPIVGIDNEGIWIKSDTFWEPLCSMTGEKIYALTSEGTEFFVCSNLDCYQWNGSILSAVIPGYSSKLSVVRRDKQGRLWGGDRYKGLISIRTDGIESIMPNGPFSNNIWRFDVSGNKLMVSAGGYDVSSSPSNSFEGIFQFEAGKWSNFNRYEYPTYEDISDIVDITTSGSSSGFFSAFGKGIYKFDHLSSPNLITLPGLGVNPRVSSLYYDEDGLWFTLIGSTDALWLYGNDSQLTSFNIGSNTHPSELLGHQDYIYIRLEPDVGGRMIVFDKITKRHRYLSATEGAGGLPGDRVNAMVLDQQGKLWLGTDQGVAFFDRMAMEGPVDAIKPMVGYVPLFRGKEVLALTVDGGNRKWIGTTQGVWLYDAQGESEIVHFNQNNSPLLPGNIRGIAVLPASGEVFFGTENGIVSYRSDATAGAQQHTNVKIFPNPVIPEYNGLVGISGLPMAADVKVTDAAGRLVWKGVSNGGTASWNVLDYRGQRPASGVYFVFSVAPDGTDTYVGKIAVIK